MANDHVISYANINLFVINTKPVCNYLDAEKYGMQNGTCTLCGLQYVPEFVLYSTLLDLNFVLEGYRCFFFLILQEVMLSHIHGSPEAYVFYIFIFSNAKDCYWLGSFIWIARQYLSTPPHSLATQGAEIVRVFTDIAIDVTRRVFLYNIYIIDIEQISIGSDLPGHISNILVMILDIFHLLELFLFRHM